MAIQTRFSTKAGAQKGQTKLNRGNAQIIKNLRKEIRLIDGDIGNALELAALHIKAKSQALTPVRFGILINSAFSDVIRFGSTVTARIGYTAKYAAAVHEMPPGTNFTKAGAENKFLEKAVVRNVSTILALIRRHAKR